MCNDGRAKPCSTSNAVQFITQTSSGTHNGTTTGTSYEFDWTPPTTNAGNVTLTPVEPVVTPDPDPNRPAVTASRVTDATLYHWMVLSGTSLASTTRAAVDVLAGGELPQVLDGVSVTLNGKAASIAYGSPVPLHVVATVDDPSVAAEVKVTLNSSTSDAFTATVQPFAPLLVTADGRKLSVSETDGEGVTSIVSTVKPGDTILLQGTGFGPAAPDSSVLTVPFTVTIGDVPATATAVS